MKFELNNLVRENIKKLVPYSSARSEFKGSAAIFLDANENSYGSTLNENYNRYPDPLQLKLKDQLAIINRLPGQNIFIGNGSDEVIDLVYRIFCEPGKDNVIICPPTYGMYEVSANINNTAVKKVPLTKEFNLDSEAILSAIDQHTKLIFICSPNNPTGNNMNREDILKLLEHFNGLLIIDEAYIHFSEQESFAKQIELYKNLIVMQTLSKAWGLAGLRLGVAFADVDIVNFLNKVKPPYNVNQVSQELALAALKKVDQQKVIIKEIILERELLKEELKNFSFVRSVYKSDSNFLLVQVNNADDLYSYLTNKKIIVRNRSKEISCENCLRITVGTKEENIFLLTALKEYS